MVRVSSTFIFQACCAGTALLEVSAIVGLLHGDLLLHELGGWVDNTPESDANKPLLYILIAVLACLVTARVMACMLPKSRMIVAYNIVVHSLELACHVYCCQHKSAASTNDSNALSGLMVINLSIFVGRLVQLRRWQATAAVADHKWRQEQLAAIRQKRAEYAQRKETKKNN